MPSEEFSEVNYLKVIFADSVVARIINNIWIWMNEKKGIDERGALSLTAAWTSDHQKIIYGF